MKIICGPLNKKIVGIYGASVSITAHTIPCVLLHPTLYEGLSGTWKIVKSLTMAFVSCSGITHFFKGFDSVI